MATRKKGYTAIPLEDNDHQRLPRRLGHDLEEFKPELMPPGSNTSSDAGKKQQKPEEIKLVKKKEKSSDEGHSGSSESQDPGPNLSQFPVKTTCGSLPPSFVDKLHELQCTKCNTRFSSRNKDANPYYAYCDIVCKKCVDQNKFSDARCKICESHWPTNANDADKQEFERYDALLDLYTIIETVEKGYRCTKCCKLNPIKNTVNCNDARDHDKEPVKSETGYVVCMWCARDHHKGHSRLFLDETKDQPSKVDDSEVIRSFDSSSMKPYFLIHCASCGRIFLGDNPTGKPSTFTISCGHFIGKDRETCCDAVTKNSNDIIDCIFCERKVSKGPGLRHFKYLNDFVNVFGTEVKCSIGCGRSHPDNNCENGEKCIWCVVRNWKPEV